ncbi:hypothetical protein EU545_04455 [Candidatus Thorarchaeota archaeon]|nr:MAG: hypothetical protein EU545_04455 [Candidatus Thorarchaeota archaeon]
MRTTLFDLIDEWTLEWDRAMIDLTLDDVSKAFYQRGLVFLALEKLWDLLEIVDDPSEYVTDQRKIAMVEKLLREKGFEKAAMSVEVEVSEGSVYRITVVNADELISLNPSWFETYDRDE